MKKTIRLTESDLVRLVNKVIYEQEENDSFFSRIIRGAKDVIGIENPRDRKSLESIYQVLEMEPSMVGSIVAKGRSFMTKINGEWLIVDADEPEIRWKGKRLKLNDLQDETYALMNALVPYYIDQHRR